MSGPERPLSGRVVLITGTGGGQGREAAFRFATEGGAVVVGCDINESGSKETTELVRDAGGEMSSKEPVDLGDPAEVEALVATAVDLYGTIDVVYNNASAQRFGTIEDLTPGDWDFTMRNDLKPVFLVTKYSWPHLKAKGGSIVNIASLSGIYASARVPGAMAHGTAKAGVIALTRYFATEGAKHGIRANSISPSAVETPANRASLQDPEVRARMLGATLLGRLGQPEDIVNCAMFLASDAASFITGSNVMIDGGAAAAK